MCDRTAEQDHQLCPRWWEWAKAEAALGTTHIIQNSIPVRYDRRVRVVPCSPDRVPRLPVEIFYLIAQALPRPKWVYNLARVDKQSWYYLRPALFQCEVTYEARLKENFGIRDDTWEYCCMGWPDDDPSDGCRCRCEGCLNFNITLGEKCGDKIAIEKVVFEAGDRNCYWSLRGHAMRSDVTALHWACMKGADGVPAGLQAIRSASVHQPSYIDGIGLILRREVSRLRDPNIPLRQSWVGFTEEIPPPLFLSVVFGNAELCQALIEAGCNVNLLRPDTADYRSLQDRDDVEQLSVVVSKIHSNCGTTASGSQESDCQWYDTHFGCCCQTVGHMAMDNGKSYMLETLLEGGLDPYLGTWSLIHRAVRRGDAIAVKILLNRYPELGKLRRGANTHTPLHLLYDITQEKQDQQLSITLDIARFLVQSGADMEAEAHPSGSIDDFSEWGTPLQWSLLVADVDGFEEQGIRAAEALITLGSIWNKPFRPSMPRKSILDHCISRAIIAVVRPPMWFEHATQEEFEVQRLLRYTLLVRAMVKTTFDCGPGRGRTQPGAEKRKAFLAAFNEIAMQSVTLPTQYDAFATEVVGKLLLSTGIVPDASVVSNWTQSMRKIQGWTAQTLSGRKRSLWEDIMSGRPINHQELEVG